MNIVKYTVLKININTLHSKKTYIICDLTLVVNNVKYIVMKLILNFVSAET
jgi:hypothetical protein